MNRRFHYVHTPTRSCVCLQWEWVGGVVKLRAEEFTGGEKKEGNILGNSQFLWVWEQRLQMGGICLCRRPWLCCLKERGEPCIHCLCFYVLSTVLKLLKPLSTSSTTLVLSWMNTFSSFLSSLYLWYMCHFYIEDFCIDAFWLIYIVLCFWW